MPGFVLRAAMAALAISLIVIVHELGHFLMAKLVGMRVEVFSVGFWKRLIGIKVGDTDYRLSLIPFGGYVKVSGESAHAGAGQPYEFWSKTPGQRALFVLGGVLMNFVLAVVLFIGAFTLGVPMPVAEVGSTEQGSAAWEAGLKPGDRILAINGRWNPTFDDLRRAAALGGPHPVRLVVERDGRRMDYEIYPRYDEQTGFRLLGVVPPIEPVVTALTRIGGPNGRAPASEAGVRLEDRVLAINGRPVSTAQELMLELAKYPNDVVELTIRRDGKELTLRVRTEPVSLLLIGISGLSTVVEALEGDGLAQRIGLRVGDRIVAVNGQPVRAWVEAERLLADRPGEAVFQVDRSGQLLELRATLADAAELERFTRSVLFASSNVMEWVKPDGPAWRAGLRPGDVLIEVGGHPTRDWDDVISVGARLADKEHQLKWERNGEVFSGTVKAVEEKLLTRGELGIEMQMPRTVRLRYGVLVAIVKGFANTFQTLWEMVLTLRGFATRQVSPNTMGGIVTIAYVSYHAAGFGLAKLLQLTAAISAAVAFLNILPVPVLDGGHLALLAIEKVRGRRMGERLMNAIQAVGFALLALLVIYVTRNDILRLLNLQ